MNREDKSQIYDLLIIGGGPAGISAGIYAVRKNLRTLLISLDLGGQVLLTSEIGNFIGYQYISGRELAEKFTEHLRSLPISLRVPDEVISLKWEGGLFFVETKFQGRYKGKAVIVATGKRPRSLDVPGERELTGRGVSYCVTCDAPLFVNKDTAVIGGGNSAVSAALDLSKVANKVYLIVRSQLRADPVLLEKLDKTEKIEKLIGFIPKAIEGRSKVEGIVIKNVATEEERKIPLQGVFVEVGLIPNSDFLKGLVKTNELGEIIVTSNCETSQEGIFACGDVTNVAGKQIIIACGEGAKAALGAYRYLLTKK